MIRNITALRALRVFEAAGHRLSFTRAAADMAVTPAAISHQIKELEEQIGTPLFTRTSRTMKLTAEGQLLLTAVREALDGLSLALGRIRKRSKPNQLRVTASPSIAAKWLVPRIDRFIALHPGSDVRIDVSQAVLDFDNDEVDVAIRFGRGEYPGLRVDRMFDEIVFPVCSPRLLNGAKPIREPRDLLRHTLIHLDWQAQGAVWPNWRMWMLAAGIKEFDDTRGLHFSQTSLALQAAIDGQGVALGESSLAADDLATGRLVKPFALSIRAPTQFAYFVISPLETSSPLVTAFHDWIVAEAISGSTVGAPLA